MGHSGLTEIKSETRMCSNVELPCKKPTPQFQTKKAYDTWFRLHGKMCQGCAGKQLNQRYKPPVIMSG